MNRELRAPPRKPGGRYARSFDMCVTVRGEHRAAGARHAATPHLGDYFVEAEEIGVFDDEDDLIPQIRPWSSAK